MNSQMTRLITELISLIIIYTTKKLIEINGTNNLYFINRTNNLNWN